MPDHAPFLNHPGLPGPFGALMDEYARAAEDFCRVLEMVDLEVFTRKQDSQDPDTRSIQDMCAHAIGAAHRYADYIRKARGLPFVELFTLNPDQVPTPVAIRPLLREALRYTEGALDGLYDAKEEEVSAVTFAVRWGPTYDPEMILEHGIVHLLRHRRQVERWPVSKR
jgi:hypothetical protein